MAKYGNARYDESKAMKNYWSGYEKADKSNERYMPKGMGKVMGHDKSPRSVDVPVGAGWKEVKECKVGNKGYPQQAWDYKY